ncbi:MAG TPA: hypothetical protein VJC39_04455 [Candidatus Nanoarchaeia archaeon]|nr:hypothetical protein [Candidatus Nanoarchaeia archaeon]
MKLSLKSISSKPLGIILILVILLNFILFAFTIINWIVFVVVLGISYILMKKLVPKIKTN